MPKKIARRLSVMLGAAMVTGSALATTGPAAQYDATSLVAQLTADMQNAATSLFPVLVIGIGLTVGWKYIRRFGKSV